MLMSSMENKTKHITQHIQKASLWICSGNVIIMYAISYIIHPLCVCVSDYILFIYFRIAHELRKDDQCIGKGEETETEQTKE